MATPAQLEEIVNTLHLLAAEEGGAIGAGGDAAIDSAHIDQALTEMSTESGKPIGFH